MNNIVLTGVLQQIPPTIHCNGRIYSKDVFDNAIREYLQKHLKKTRKEKLEKINEKYNN